MLRKLRKGNLVVMLVATSGLFLTGCGSVSPHVEGSARQPVVSSTKAAPVESQMPHMQPATAKPLTTINNNSSTNLVVIENFSFSPAMLSVAAGTKVTWVNRDDEPHTATDDDKRFNSKTLDTNDQFAFTFTEPGTYNYFCALHPRMRGQIVVR